MLPRNPPNPGETCGYVSNASPAQQAQGWDYAEEVEILLRLKSPADLQPI